MLARPRSDRRSQVFRLRVGVALARRRRPRRPLSSPRESDGRGLRVVPRRRAQRVAPGRRLRGRFGIRSARRPCEMCLVETTDRRNGNRRGEAGGAGGRRLSGAGRGLRVAPVVRGRGAGRRRGRDPVRGAAPPRGRRRVLGSRFFTRGRLAAARTRRGAASVRGARGDGRRSNGASWRRGRASRRRGHHVRRTRAAAEARGGRGRAGLPGRRGARGLETGPRRGARRARRQRKAPGARPRGVSRSSRATAPRAPQRRVRAALGGAGRRRGGRGVPVFLAAPESPRVSTEYPRRGRGGAPRPASAES